MATSIRDLKKEVKYAFEELIQEALMLQLAEGEDKERHALINEMVEAYEGIIKKINAHRQTKDKKAYFKELNREIAETLAKYREKLVAE
ncbi:MAG: hypothetical protein GXO27_04735 [Chlorobi bacterium]|nr:hypothetical protein [Chlorobiota bacterium]